MMSVMSTLTSRILFVLGILYTLGSRSDAAKILLMPASVNSHVNYFSRLGLALAKEGHMVTAIVPSVSRVPDWFQDKNVDVIKYSVPGEEPFTNSPRATELLVKQAFTDSLRERINVMNDFGKEVIQAWNDECESLLSNTELKEQLRQRKLDHCIIDPVFIGCQAVLPYSLDIPISSYSVYSFTWIFRVPALPSFFPSLLTDNTDVMTFKQRLQNVAAEVAAYFMQNATDLQINIRRFAPHKPELSRLDLAKQCQLWFVLYDIATGYPAPLMPNVVPVGDVLAVPANPLPPDLLQFLESAPDGVVLVSFGSTFDYLPTMVIKRLCHAFKRIPQKVIWKLRQSELCVDKGKILTQDWFPQNDLLGHPKVKLFVSHVGISSVVETIYHGVPVISAPIGIDQHFNSAFMTSRKFGVHMSLNDFTVEGLVKDIKFVINDAEIKKNVQTAAAILRNKPDNPGSRASFWLNHVIKYGDKSLKTGSFELNIFQFYMVDIYLFLTLVIVIAISMVSLITYCTCKFCIRCVRGTMGKSEKEKTN